MNDIKLNLKSNISIRKIACKTISFKDKINMVKLNKLKLI